MMIPTLGADRRRPRWPGSYTPRVIHFDRRDHRGWDVLTLSDDEIRLEVLPGLGGTIWSLARVLDGAQVLWNPPWSLRRVGSPSLPGRPRR